jgi:4-hydroxy-tetrahydrodipicolinate synthase
MSTGLAARLVGNIPALVTPFDARGGLMLDAFERLVDWHLACGVGGICIAGDNGESWALTKDERRTLYEAGVKRVRGRVPVICGASATTARDSIAYAEIAASAGADAILLQPQAYVLKATTAEIVQRYAAVAKAVSIPVVAYNSPRRTGLNMEPDCFAAVCDVAPVVATKEASRDFFHVTRMIERFGRKVNILAGPAPFIMPSVALGARGFISSGPEIFGRAAQDIMALASAAPSDAGRAMHNRLTTIYVTLMETGTWPAALKQAHRFLGLEVGVPREPVQPLGQDQAERLRRTMIALGLIASDVQAAE